MKKLAKFAMFLGAIALSACSKEIPSSEAEEKGTTVITLSLPNDSKTAILNDEGAYKLVWSEGDVVVLNGVVSHPVAAEYVGRSEAEFVFDGVIDAPFNLSYCGVEAKDAVVFPTVQKAPQAGAIDANSTAMYASSTTATGMEFFHLGAVLKFTFSGEESLKSIVVMAPAGEKISGEFTLGKSDGLYDGTISGGTSDCITLDTDGESLEGGKVFYVSLPAGTYAEGLQIIAVPTVPKEGQTAMKLSFKATGCSLAAGKVYEFAPKEFSYNTSELFITSVSDLLAFGKNYGSYAKSDGVEAKLVCDLDMTGAAYLGPNEYFGSFDGLGHTVKGLDHPLFGNLCGQVRNVTLESNIVFDPATFNLNGATDYGIGVVAHYLYATRDVTISGAKQTITTDAIVENVTTKGSISIVNPTTKAHAFQIGGIVGASNGAPVKNCVNHADVTIGSGYSVTKHTEGTSIYVLACGGIVGTCQTSKNATLTDCVNYGKVTASQSGAEEGVFVGGIVGYYAQPGTMDGCKNYGQVEYNGASSQVRACVGGLMGQAVDAKQPAIKNSTNYGKVIFGGTATVTSYVGGCTGYNINSTLTNVHNEGDVEMSAEMSGGMCYTGGVASASIHGNSTNMSNKGNILVKGKSGYHFVGGITGYEGGYNLKQVSNSGNITVDGASATQGTGFALGGITGQHKGSHTLDGAVNSGNVTIEKLGDECLSSGVRLDIGGLEGYGYKEDANTTYTYKNCVNNGTVTVKDMTKASAVHAGGLVGYFVLGKEGSYTGTLSMTDCQNNGAAVKIVTNDTFKDVIVGGIVGDLRCYGGKTATFTGCQNVATVEIQGAAGASHVAVAGIVGQTWNNNLNITFDGCVNKGTVALREDTKDSIRPSAGGIIAILENQAGENLNAVIKNCVNDGNIERTMSSSATAKKYNGSDYYNMLTCGGGIIGSVGYFYTGGSTYCIVDATIERCTNNGVISFNRKRDSITNTAAPVENNADGENVYCGGIAGMTYVADDHKCEIVACVNNGNLINNYGKCGGIVGIQRHNTTIKGVNDGGVIEYCVSNGTVGRNPSIAMGSAGYCYGYYGGITGYLFGDGTNTIEYCHVTDKVICSGNYGSGGIVGSFGTASNAKPNVVRYVKTNFIGRPSSTAVALVDGGKTGLVLADCPKIADDPNAVLANVSDLAVGGSVYKYASEKWGVVKPDASNFMSYFAGNTYQPDATWAEEHNVVYWDGSSKTSWEE